MKVALLASRRMVLGFLLGGIHQGYVCETVQESKNALKSCLTQPDIGIILISRAVASLIPETIKEVKISSRLIPVISVIPDGPMLSAVCEG